MSDQDKRKYKRFKGKEGAFAAFIRPDEFINLGQIIDISLGGLCIRYLSTKQEPKGCSGIKIFGSNGRFIHVDKVQCKVIYDEEIPEGTWEQLSTRRCGVKFENLTVRDKSMIQDFIDHYGYDEALKN
ncbi:MAG: PilZ domain-containing protein [Desulfobacteraceae bacterium]|nr:PilZ domain-containing protein [Desulfobacteraceae bacterium]